MWFQRPIKKPVASYIPDRSESYWYITDRLSVDWDYMDQYIGGARVRIGNCFRTRRDAEKCKKEIKKLLFS